MKRNKRDALSPQGLLIIYRILIMVAVLAALSLLGGTIFILVTRGINPVDRASNQALSPLSVSSHEKKENIHKITQNRIEKIFVGIGRLRLFTAPPQPAMVILSMAFPYNPEDKAFSEELALRIKDFRMITSDYFASFSEDQLRLREESVIKADLLSRFNAILRLGEITTLFFNDYIIME
jgi:flagellar basal body-associated protein FliL